MGNHEGIAGKRYQGERGLHMAARWRGVDRSPEDRGGARSTGGPGKKEGPRGTEDGPSDDSKDQVKNKT